MGCILNGVALSPRYPFFVTFVESNTDKSRSGFFIGLTQTAVTIGGVVAFAFSGIFSNFHVSLREVDISPLHPRWIGAWWLGFIIFGTLCIFSAIPMFFFPRKFENEAPDDKYAEDGENKDAASKLLGNEKHEKEEGKDQEKSSKLSILDHIKAYFRIVWHLFNNPVYVFTELASICTIFAVAGSGAFLPKYMELQFMVPAWQSNIITSGIMLCSAGGTLLGGWITAKSSMTPTRNLKLSIIIVTISMLIDCCIFFLACDYYDFTDA
ncbi:hypothetical protein LOTGIDRAFT_174220 [Lottia gigantea]|uniref:Major facilitator superfamily (MFS) profile domain-containing protein n=1 Tax=Lottia gigantea TaxID=225164 RepID=V4AN07_LOTGI|nr:hypothetical protein LOTGIDRAFT_174220 [Lottia gigantea]ESO98537.1 hypothetical protein LOTGIDRAFT_174220 [Lottia gigantea]